MTRDEFREFIESREVSWSFISSFEYSPIQWYKSYVLKIKTTSPEMEFGSMIGKKLETDPTFLPMIPRQRKMEYKFKALYNGFDYPINLVGFGDSFGEIGFTGNMDDVNFTHALEEFKTGVKEWNQKRVDEHGQITMYCFMKHLSHGIMPEKIHCRLWWMPTRRIEHGDFTVEINFVKNMKPIPFVTSRTTRDIMMFGMRINKVLKEMEEYCINHS
jgi:hypothetical protein